MAKRKNEILAAWRRGAKRLAVTLIVLGVVALGAGGFVLSSPSSTYDPNAIADYIAFPRQAEIFEPFCLSIDGISDPSAPTGVLSDSDIWATEIYIDGMKIPDTRFASWLSRDLPGTAHWCYPYGLDRGEHEMGLKLQTASGAEIATYSWMITVDQKIWSAERVESKIVQISTQEQYMPQSVQDLHSLTRGTTARTPICVAVDVDPTVFDSTEAVNNYVRWSELFINGVKVSPDKITVMPNPTAHLLTFCLNSGLSEGMYAAHFTLKSTQSDRHGLVDFSYDWVLTIQPGQHDEMRDGCGHDH